MSRSTFKSFHLCFDTLIFFILYLFLTSSSDTSLTQNHKKWRFHFLVWNELSENSGKVFIFAALPWSSQKCDGSCHRARKRPFALEYSLTFAKNFTFRLHLNNISIPQSWNHTRTISIIFKRLIEGDEMMNFTPLLLFIAFIWKRRDLMRSWRCVCKKRSDDQTLDFSHYLSRTFWIYFIALVI